MACHLSNEFPAGRQIVLIANDITHKAGSFGTMEDKLFSAATVCQDRGYSSHLFGRKFWRQDWYGGRGKEAYKVAWVNEADPSKGFNYIYLTPEDYQRLKLSGVLQQRRSPSLILRQVKTKSAT